MIKIFQLALRSMFRFKAYTLINILGLTLSLVCAVIIFRYVYGEFTVDHFNKNLDWIYISVEDKKGSQSYYNGVYNPNKEENIPNILEHPGVERYSEFTIYSDDHIQLNNTVFHATSVVADSNFLKILDYPIIEGREEIGSNPRSVLITSSFAKKIFGEENPVGRKIKYSNSLLLTVTGIIGETSNKSLLDFDLIVSRHMSTDWMGRMPHTLALLYPNTDYKSVNKEHETYFPSKFWKGEIRFQLAPYKGVYFDKEIAKLDDDKLRTGNKTNALVLLFSGLLILFIGVTNFINIYTVVILKRSREFGMKKVFGAKRKDILTQILTESIIMIGISVVMALVLAELMTPIIRNQMGLDQFPDFKFSLYLSLAFLIVLPLVVSIFPFIQYNYSTPITSIKGLDKRGRTSAVQQAMLIFQYAVTITILIVSMMFAKQLHFLLNTDLGYRTKDIIKVDFKILRSEDARIWSEEERDKEINNRERIFTELPQRMDASPLFSSWSINETPNKMGDDVNMFSFHADEYKDVTLIWANESWFKMFDIELLDGRSWDMEQDVFSYNLIASESALKYYGISDYKSAQLQSKGRLWYSYQQEGMDTNPPFRIVGVTKDFTVGNLIKLSKPTIFVYGSESNEAPLIAAIQPGKKQEAISFLNELHDDLFGSEFNYTFLEDDIRNMYEDEQRVAIALYILTAIAIFISMMGLFSMSLFDIQQRYREIAIRKVNGASVAEIIKMLLKKYMRLLIVAFVISAPVAWYAINRYLEDFALKTPVSWWLFVVAFVATAAISLLTLIYQTNKAANQDPAKVLKSE